MRRVLRDLLDFLVIIIGHERLVAIELLKRFDRLDRVGVDHFVPDELLPLLRRQLADELVNGVEFLHARNIEAAAELIEGVDDGGGAVDLHRIVDLHTRKMLAKRRIVLAELVVIHDEERRSMLLGEGEERFFVHGFCRVWGPISPRRSVKSF